MTESPEPFLLKRGEWMMNSALRSIVLSQMHDANSGYGWTSDGALKRSQGTREVPPLRLQDR
jgi:hypothetical protein